MVFRGRNANHWNHLSRTGRADEHANRLDAPASVLHVEHCEVGSRLGGNLADSRRTEFEHERADRRAAALQPGFDMIGSHGVLSINRWQTARAFPLIRVDRLHRD